VIYDLLVYGKGAMLFHSLREEIGDELFFRGLFVYFQENCFKNAGKDGYDKGFNQVRDQDWQQHFDNGCMIMNNIP
jgi:aminopeptidase N